MEAIAELIECHYTSKLITFGFALLPISVSQLPLLFLCSACLKYSTASPQTHPSCNFYSCCLLSFVTSLYDIQLFNSLTTSTGACCLAHILGNLSKSHSQIRSLPCNIDLVFIFLRKRFSQDTRILRHQRRLHHMSFYDIHTISKQKSPVSKSAIDETQLLESTLSMSGY